MSKTVFYIMTHRKFNPPELPEYMPLQVGAALNPDLGYLRDDGGDNISDLNPYYSELTGQYYLWKNCHDVDIIGSCHYRRYLINDRKQIMTAADAEKILETHDIIAPSVTDDKTCRELWNEAHNPDDLNALRRAMERLYPDDVPAFDCVMNDHVLCYGNILVMRKALYDDYMEWLFNILIETGEEINIDAYDEYHKRIYGFLSENMIRVFALAKGKKLYLAKAAITAEKAETAELKRALSVLMERGEHEEAAKLLDDYLKLRPDLLLEQSDINGELLKIRNTLIRIKQG